MSFLLPPLEPHFEAALRDVDARTPAAREAAAARLARPDHGREQEAEVGLIRLLDDRLPQVRATALRSLAELGGAGAHEPVCARLQDPDPLVRELSVVALSGIEHPRRADVLMTALDHPAPEVRFQAVVATAELYPELAADPLIARSRDPDDRVREAAARALSSLATHDGRALPRLRALLEDAAHGVRFEAALALATAATHAPAPESDAEFARIPPPDAAIAALVEALADPSRRFDALDALGHYRTPAAIAAVAGLGRRVLLPPVVNAMAGRTLVRMGERELGLACLRDALRALRGDGRNLALEAIRELCLPELAPELERLSRRLRGCDPETLVSACGAIAAQAEPARRALARLSRRADSAGQLANELLRGAKNDR